MGRMIACFGLKSEPLGSNPSWPQQGEETDRRFRAKLMIAQSGKSSWRCSEEFQGLELQEYVGQDRVDAGKFESLHYKIFMKMDTSNDGVLNISEFVEALDDAVSKGEK